MCLRELNVLDIQVIRLKEETPPHEPLVWVLKGMEERERVGVTVNNHGWTTPTKMLKRPNQGKCFLFNCGIIQLVRNKLGTLFAAGTWYLPIALTLAQIVVTWPWPTTLPHVLSLKRQANYWEQCHYLIPNTEHSSFSTTIEQPFPDSPPITL